MGPPSYVRSLVHRNVVVRRMSVIKLVFLKKSLSELYVIKI